ncbi:MAG TPA: hypothetical protein VFM29_08695, partial [Vicinamibacteria bacterium]|nr:hypothetical protein [Vicinamibacteria bacterium]
MSPTRAGVDRTVPPAALPLLALVPVLVLGSGCGERRASDPRVAASAAASLPPGDYTPREPRDAVDVPAGSLAEARREALRRARVWSSPASPVRSADLGRPAVAAADLGPQATVDCRFVL